jgi:predicted metal-dependent enzyme (double-stranded beta helix superfamily)
MATVERFDVEEYSEELARAEENVQIGTTLLFENDRIRVWELKLGPGERVPFHHHRTPYFWVCIDGGRAIQRYPDGHLIEVDFDSHDTDFLDEERLVEERIHDLENTGDTTFRFHAFELLR